MSLSCSCSEWDGEGWYYVLAEKTISPGDSKTPREIEYFFPLATKRSRRCCSCSAIIKPGDLSLVFKRWRGSTQFEYDRLGWEEVKIAPWFMCESCGEIYLNLEAVGYCVNIDDYMPNLLEEHREVNGIEVEA